jgi:hypothetical protein
VALRLRIVLECATGAGNSEVAERLGGSCLMAGKWRSRAMSIVRLPPSHVPPALAHSGGEHPAGKGQDDNQEGDIQGILKTAGQTAIAHVYADRHRQKASENGRPAQPASDQTADEYRSAKEQEGQPQQDAEITLETPFEPAHNLGVGKADLLLRRP